jgi:hypothetical protein
LLAEAARPDRRFDAVVIGEYERAFTGRQALQIIPYLRIPGGPSDDPVRILLAADAASGVSTCTE